MYLSLASSQPPALENAPVSVMGFFSDFAVCFKSQPPALENAPVRATTNYVIHASGQSQPPALENAPVSSARRVLKRSIQVTTSSAGEHSCEFGCGNDGYEFGLCSHYPQRWRTGL